ncbi:MAG: SAP domain-containing protein, partial [Nitrosarchaeum sp.]
MGLTVEKLLCEYFSKEEVQDALRDIGEPTSGTKEELVEELRKNWESFNRDKYELLDFIDEETLQEICYYFNLDASPA